MRVGTRAAWDLFAVSFLCLFFELLVIRWIPTVIGPMAYFTNLSLILAFLGIGAGCLLARNRRDLFQAFPVAALMLAGAVTVLQNWRISFVDASVVFLNEPAAAEPDAGSLPLVSIVLVLGVLAPLITLSFICVGQEMGRRLNAFTPLAGYALNVAGSAAGVAGFAVLAWLGSSPAAWFLLAGLLTLWLMRGRAKRLAIGALAFLAILMMVGRTPSDVFWSPYYRIKVTPVYDQAGPQRQFVGSTVDVNTVFHQYHLDLSGRIADPPGPEPFLARYAELYDLPYRVSRPARVLVLGAGGGNDVAAALRHGASQEDAVEIDPVIARLGRDRHPERPYADPRVRVVVDDARAFLRKADGPYDLIVIGFLDTIRLLSEFSSVRLESYVYTRESLDDIKRLLAPEGMFALGFSVTSDWMMARLYGLARDTFGGEPLIYTAGRSSVILVKPSGTITPEAFRHLWQVERAPLDQLLAAGLPTPTDDWPFLYMRTRAIPQQYWIVLVGVLLFALALVGAVSPRRGAGFEWPFFFLGAAFMLVETLSITRLARFLGSTWVVSSAVILLILVTILAATWWVGKRRLPLTPVYGVLAAVLAVSFSGREIGAGAVCALIGATIFLASVIFATAFRQAPEPSPAFGANILGAVAGGLLENLSLVFGLQALYLVAAGLYLLSYLTMGRTVK